ncbi:hypothetical protein HZS_252 [Henneguya salminicola]|nr:hypothetical protein HZS_252 [Henneguya salminicola]
MGNNCFNIVTWSLTYAILDHLQQIRVNIYWKFERIPDIDWKSLKKLRILQLKIWLILATLINFYQSVA